MTERNGSNNGENFAGNQSQDKSELLGEMIPMLTGFMLRRTGNPEIAEDLASQTILKALEGLPKYQEKGVPFSAWVIRIARNTLVSYYRSSKNNLPMNEEAITGTGFWTYEDKYEDPYDKLNLRDDVESLSPSQKEVIILRFFRDLSADEISEKLKKKSGTVRVNQTKAIHNLRRNVSRRDKAIKTSRSKQGYSPNF